MLYVALASSCESTKSVSATEIQTENGKKFKVTAHGPADSQNFIKTFVALTKNSKDKAVVAATDKDLENVLPPILEHLVTSSGGKIALVSARELTSDEPRSLLSGSYNLLEEVIAKSSPEILEYFRQAFRTRQSLSVFNPAVLSVTQNGFSINCIILPHSQSVEKISTFSNATLVVMTDSNHDPNLIKLAESLKSQPETKRATTKQLRKNLNQLNRDLMRQKRADGDQRKELMNLIKDLNETKENSEEARIQKAQKFMSKREEQLAENGLTWSIKPELDDLSAKLQLEYQNLRIDLESARQNLDQAKVSNNQQEITTALQTVRRKEVNLAACQAKISNDSVVALHHQLRSQRDISRMEHAQNIRKAQAEGASDNDLLVSHTEAQRRLITTLENDIDTIIDHHKHQIEKLRQKQLDTLQKYRQLVEGSYSDKILRLESLLHEVITDSF